MEEICLGVEGELVLFNQLSDLLFEVRVLFYLLVHVLDQDEQ